jgi:amino acid transporter
MNDIILLAFTNPAANLFVDFTTRGSGNDFNSVIINIISWFLGVIGFVSIIYLIYGGFQMMLAGANPSMAESGKKTVRNSIIGLIIVILSYIIVTVVVNSFTNIGNG